MSIIIKVKKSTPQDPIPEGLYSAYVQEISAAKGEFGEYLKFAFVITDGKYRNIQRNSVCNKIISYSEKGKHSKLYLYIKALTGQAPTIGEDFDIESLKGKACQILVKDDKEKDGILYQKITDIMPAKVEEAPEPTQENS
jgi:hypothetical protein